MIKYIDFIKEGNEGHSFRDIVDNLDEQQFEDAAEEYHQAKLKLLNLHLVTNRTLKYDCDDCKNYPCIHQTSINDMNRKISRNVCGDHQPKES